MNKKGAFLGLLSTLVMAWAANGANIVWVSLHPGDASPSTAAAGTGFTTAPDKAYTDLLKAHGHTVTRYGSTATPDTGELNAADLVIVSRAVASGNYQDAAATTWNNVTAPMMILNGYAIRQNRLGLATGNTIPDITGDITLTASDPFHPLFAGIPLSGGTMVNPYAGLVKHPATGATMRGISIVTEPPNANGTILATVSTAGNGPAGAMVVAEWPAGALVTHAGGAGTDSLGGPRLVFLTGSRETSGVSSETAGCYDLYPDGARMFLNAVLYILEATQRASIPGPEVGQTDIPRDGVLHWTPGADARTHDVYLGTVAEDVNAASRTDTRGVLVSQGQDANTFDPAGLMAFGRTYYWRVDEVGDLPGSTVCRGVVWSFTTEPYAYVIAPVAATASSSFTTEMVPDKTIDESGLDDQDGHSTLDQDMWLSGAANPGPIWIQYEFDHVIKLYQMWVWNCNQMIEGILGLGAREVLIETSVDGTSWTALGMREFARAPGQAGYKANTIVDLEGIPARYVRLTIQGNWGKISPQCGLSEVRFFHLPVRAFEPSPVTGQTNVALDATLTWRPGREAVDHEVYFGTDPNALVLATTVTDREVGLTPLGLAYDTTYYWRVDEVNTAAVPSSWEGEPWSLTTVAYGVVDDFESYDDGCNRVFFSWLGGAPDSGSTDADCPRPAFAGNGTGSEIGNLNPPYAEQTVVHSGRQSMPFWYDNGSPPFYSEASREWAVPQSWARGGADSLTVYYRFDGQAQAFAELSPGLILMNGMGTDIYGTADQGRFVYKPLSGDGAIVARVDSLGDTHSWAKAGVMIRETLEAGSPFAMAVYGGANGVRVQMRLTAGGGAASDTATATADQMAARAPVWLKIERIGAQLHTYYATGPGSPTVWTPMSGSPQTIAMANDVYIGLAVTSHVADVVCGARFSGVSTTGGATGAWVSADLGVPQASGGDTLEPVYAAVEDSRGKVRVVSGPDPKTTIAGAWERWDIPLSDLTAAGVDVGSVKKVTIGVGDRVSPKAGGAGKLTLDDLRLTRAPAP
ncbi:MAG: discoidin domain-containing protein [Phycisphaerae bacterium]|nr:discoidin domain-containing protein [Phycisphaerae bacterium]